MRILLVNPPYLPRFSRSQRSPAVTRSGTLYYPLWLSQAGAVLEEAGQRVKMIDAPARGMGAEEALAEARTFAPALAVIDTSTPSIAGDLRFAGRLKEALPGCFVAAVGTHVSVLPEEALAGGPGLDGVAVGEYDLTLRELAAALEQGVDPAGVAGLVLRRGRGEAGGEPGGERFLRTPPRPLLEDLDSLPFVSRFYRRHLVPGHYFNPNALYPMVTILTSRGCPHGCSFCLYPQTMTGRRLRCRSPEHVVAELEYVAASFPEARGVFFEDDTFTASPERVESLCRALIRSPSGLPWTANARADVPADLLRLMREAGCRQLCVGFESGSAAALEFIGKGLGVERMLRFAEDARAAGILVHGCFIVGFPGETAADLERTYRLARRLRPDTAQFYPVMVYPGTRAYDWYREHGLLRSERFEEWLDEEGLHGCVISTGSLEGSDLVAFCNRARRRFYLRPGYLLYKGRQVWRDPREIVRNVKALRTFARHLLRG